MKYIRLGSTDVPAIGLGTYKLTGPEAIGVIATAIELGYRHIDTAQLYDNEKEVGLAIHHSGLTRGEFFLTTKVWPSNLRADKFIPSVEQSLEKLGTSHVDLLLIHWPHQTLSVESYIETLMICQQRGFAKLIGVSNFNILQLKTALHTGADIVTNQVEFHPWVNQSRLYQWMREKQIRLTGYWPLGQGRFIEDKKLEALAAKYLRSPAQIILRWHMQKDSVLVIPKSSHFQRLRENLHVFDFELDAGEIEMIDAWRLENQRVVGAQAGAQWD